MIEIIFFLILGILIYYKKILNLAGSITATLIAGIVWLSAGLEWLLLLLVFLFLGYGATKYRFSYKKYLKVSEKNYGRRNAINVLANGLVAMSFAVLYYFGILPHWLATAGYIASVATVTGDTISSELGVLSKKKPLLITSLKEVEHGTHGGVTLIGEIAGIFGAIFIGMLAWLLGIADINHALLAALLGGIIGFNVDSVLGATLENKSMLGNASVNLLSTLAGSISVLLIWVYVL